MKLILSAWLCLSVLPSLTFADKVSNVDELAAERTESLSVQVARATDSNQCHCTVSDNGGPWTNVAALNRNKANLLNNNGPSSDGSDAVAKN